MTTRPGQQDDITEVDIPQPDDSDNGLPRVSFSQDVVQGVEKMAKSESDVDGGRESSIYLVPRSKRMMSLCSSCSDGAICRICHEGDQKEELISPCRCSGTMGMVHQSCIEAWLGASNTTRCEICNYEYNLYREERCFKEWLKSPAAPQDRKNMVADLLCFFLLTPLSAVSCWLCISGASHYYSLKEKEHYWESIGLISLTVFLVSIYFIWMSVAIKYHCRIWKDWRNKNKRVTILNYTPSSADEQSYHSAPSSPGNFSISIALEDVTASGTQSRGMDVTEEEELGAAGGAPLPSAPLRQTSHHNHEGQHKFISYYVDLQHGGICEACHQPLTKHQVVAIQHHKMESVPGSSSNTDLNNNCDFYPDQNNVSSVPLMPYVSVPLLPGVRISSTSHSCLQQSTQLPDKTTPKMSRPLSYPHGQHTLKKTSRQGDVSPDHKTDPNWHPVPKHSSTPCRKQKKRRSSTDNESVQMLLYHGDSPSPEPSHPVKEKKRLRSAYDNAYSLLSNQGDSSFEESQGTKKATSKLGSLERLSSASDADYQSGSSSSIVFTACRHQEEKEETAPEIWLKPGCESSSDEEEHMRNKIAHLRETSV